MQTPPPHLVEAVERAAEMRFAGNGWEHVARELDQTIAAIREWPRAYREFWDQQFAACSRSRSLELRAEALACLRLQLRSEDVAVCRFAAKEVLAATEKIALPQSREPAPMSELCRFAAHLEELSDDEIAELMDEDR
jgi:hypothetical protein